MLSNESRLRHLIVVCDSDGWDVIGSYEVESEEMAIEVIASRYHYLRFEDHSTDQGNQVRIYFVEPDYIKLHYLAFE